MSLLSAGIIYFSKKFILLPCRNKVLCSRSIKLTRVPRGPVVKCLTCNQGILGLSCTGSSGFFHGSVLGAQPSTGETQERHNVSCRRDVTEILLKAALNTNQAINRSVSR